MRFLLTIHDNDFHYTLTGFIEQIQHIPNLTEEKIKLLWEHLGTGCYILYQNKFEYLNGAASAEAYYAHIKTYLSKLTVISGGDKIREYENKYDNFSNGEWFYLESQENK